MLDQNPETLATIKEACEGRYRQLLVGNCAFYQLVQMTRDEMRGAFPSVRMVGPFFLPGKGEVSLELSCGGRVAEVRVKASKRIISDNAVGW